MAYDESRGQVVLFGGAGGLNDTWVWDGTNWTQKNPVNSPSQRQLPGMAYDAARGNVVLFGGFDGAGRVLGDTWVWDGTNWTATNPLNSPQPRDFHGMVYDAARAQVVLFGGLYTNNGTNTNLNDTWVWDGVNWAQKNPSNTPSPLRYTQAMSYDAARGQVVLFGGGDGISSGYLRDTWVWDGANWTQKSPSDPFDSPTGRQYHSMVYDAARGQVILFGGYDGALRNDTWVWPR